jgi:hypothetical protein
MFVAFNIIMILLAALIAYWWANQGLFSSILHLVCVVVAGAITLAFWEPLTTNFLMWGQPIDDYMWGVSFLMLFSLSLLILRILADRLAPANVRLPHWANLTFGAVPGIGAGILTIGMYLIGIGFIQSTNTIMGWDGVGRSYQTARVTTIDSLWLPFHRWTNEFYSFLSVHSLKTSRPLRQYYPDLYKQASLIRDSYGGGYGKLTLKPSEATVRTAYVTQDRQRYLVEVHFKNGARDFGDQFTLSASQVRLIEAPDSRTDTPRTAHPDAFTQYSGHHKFDDVSHYASSEPGKANADVLLEFPVPQGFEPRFIQIRGTRYRLPQAEAIAPGRLASLRTGMELGGAAEQTRVSFANAPRIPRSDIDLTNSVRPMRASTNMGLGSLEHVDRYLTQGSATVDRNRNVTFSRRLMIQGVHEPAGTRCVRLNVSRGRPTDIFRIASEVESGARIALVDAQGNSYFPIGYMHVKSNRIDITLDPANFVATYDELPRLPTAGNQELFLYFYVTKGATIEGLRIGEMAIARCDLPVTD